MRYTLGHQNLRLCLRTVPRFLREAQWVSEANCFSTRSGRGKMGAPLRERKMVDKIRVWAKGGPGGNGCFSIRRSRADWRGKPDGGNGGRGGDVILECSDAVWDLKNLQHHLNAKKGGHGMPKRMIGSRGADKIVQVPVGTVIHLVKGELPSSVDDSNTPLYPWEILDATKVEKPTSDSHSNDLQPGQQSAKCSKDTSCPKLPGENPAEGVSSLIDSQSTRQDALTSIEVNEADTHDDENVEESSEEELEQEEIVQYNVAELMRLNQRITIASGGKGGLGNACFDKAPTNLMNSKKWKAYADCELKDADCLEFDSLESEVKDMNDDESSLIAGFPGSEIILILELKSIADVGLVGMPNVGKSTLLGAISRAKPIVGNYAFTTLRPNLGRLNYSDFSMTVADIPGIIKGAHENRGLGLAFLRHIERTKVLAYVVDLASGLDGDKGIPPWEQLRDLVLELEHYQEGLSKRPSLVVANKIDEEGAEDVFRELKRRVKGVPIFPVCAVLGEGVLELKDGLRGLVDENELHNTCNREHH